MDGLSLIRLPIVRITGVSDPRGGGVNRVNDHFSNLGVIPPVSQKHFHLHFILM